jgi:hypothetical protein
MFICIKMVKSTYVTIHIHNHTKVMSNKIVWFDNTKSKQRKVRGNLYTSISF